MTDKKTNRLPAVSLLPQLLDLEGNKIVWRYTRRLATVPGIFGTPPQVLIGHYAIDARDVLYALVTGEYPAAAHDRPEPHVRRGHWEMAWTYMDRNARRLELLTTREAEVA